MLVRVLPVLFGISAHCAFAESTRSESNSANFFSKSIGQEDTLVFDLSSAVFTSAFIEIPVSIVSNDVVNSFDFQLRFNSNKVTFQTVVNHKSYLTPAFNYDPADSTLRFSSYSLQSIEKNTPLVTIRLNRVKGVFTVSDIRLLKSWLNGELNVNKVKAGICQGDSLLLRAQQGVNYSYFWSNGEVTQQIWVSSPGVYFATIVDPVGQTFSSTVYALSARSLPTVMLSPTGSAFVCPGDSLMLSASSQPGNLFEWNTGESGAQIYASDSGSYIVTAINAQGCTDESFPLELGWYQLPDVTVSASGPLSFCQGESVILTVPFTSGHTYHWSNGYTGNELTVNATGNYQVVVTSANGCSDTSIVIHVEVFIPPPAIIIPQGPTSVCPADSVILAANQGQGYTYLWSDGQTSPVITIYQSAVITLQVTDMNGCSSLSHPLQVRIDELLGDVNADGVVDVTDYLMVVAEYGHACFACPEDINADGQVDVSDYLIVVGNYGLSCL